MLPLAAVLLQAAVVLDNDYVRVTRDSAPCAMAPAGCETRILVALGEIDVASATGARRMRRGDIAVFRARETHRPPVGSGYFEVAIKPFHAPVASPDTMIPPQKNVMRYDGDRFFIFEEQLAVGDIRPRHSHSMRVVVQLNRTRLRQKADGQPEQVRDIEPDRAVFNPPVIHTAENVGDQPLRGIVIEFKPERRR